MTDERAARIEAAIAELEAQEQAAAAGSTTRAQLEALAQAHPGEPACYTAYRQYHLGQGHADAVLGEQRQA
jgi:hypothetical protein